MRSNKIIRIGQIVPSSNLTMEREIPAMLQAREAVLPDRFSFHSARMRMKSVTKEELEAMDRDSDRCAVAIMALGKGYHRVSQDRLHGRTVENGAPAPVVTSAGALVDSLKLMGAKRIAIIAPYMRPLTQLVVDYFEAEDISVKDFIALEIQDNLAVGARDPLALIDIYKKLDIKGIDALVLSACVQMPSLAAVPRVEAECGVPVITAAIATAYQMLKALRLEARLPNAGHLLSGAFAQRARSAPTTNG
jgi:maleate isomerase